MSLSSSDDEVGSVPTVPALRARIAARARALVALSPRAGEDHGAYKLRRRELLQQLERDREERAVLAAAGLLKKAAALSKFSHLETHTLFKEGGSSDGGSLPAGGGRMAAYRRLGHLQSIARKFPDLETGDEDVETFFDGGEDEDDVHAIEGLYYGDAWSVDVTFDKRTGRAVSVSFEEDDGKGEGDMVANAKVSALLEHLLKEDDWTTFAEEIDLLMKRSGGSQKSPPLARALKAVASVSSRTLCAVRERSTTSEVSYFKSQRCVGYTKPATIFNPSSPTSSLLVDEGGHSDADNAHLVYEYCLRAEAEVATDNAEENAEASSSSPSLPAAGPSSSSSSSSSSFPPPSLLCLPPIPSLSAFQPHNRSDETTARIAAFAAASLALPRDEGGSEARAKIPTWRQVHAALLRLLECGGHAIFASASPATTPNVHHRFIFDVFRRDTMMLATRTPTATTSDATEISSSSRQSSRDEAESQTNSAPFASPAEAKQLVHPKNRSILRSIPVDISGKSIADSDHLSSIASLYHILGTCAESAALGLSMLPVYGDRQSAYRDRTASNIWSVIWRVTVPPFDATQGEHPTIVFAAQRIVPCFCQGGVRELDVSLLAVSFEIDGVNLLVTESGVESTASAAVKISAAETSAPAILAERVLRWIQEAASIVGGDGVAENKKGKRRRGKEAAANLTPSRIPPAAKRRRK